MQGLRAELRSRKPTSSFSGQAKTAKVAAGKCFDGRASTFRREGFAADDKKRFVIGGPSVASKIFYEAAMSWAITGRTGVGAATGGTAVAATRIALAV